MKRLLIEDVEMARLEAYAKKEWAEICGIPENDERIVDAESCGWPEDFKYFLKGVIFGASL